MRVTVGMPYCIGKFSLIVGQMQHRFMGEFSLIKAGKNLVDRVAQSGTS